MKFKSKIKENNKKGISLIVLVITIIVMIILAAAVILSLSSNGIIDRANEAVEKTDLKQVQTLAETLWADAYLDSLENDDVDLEAQVINGLRENGIETSEYTINVTNKGVELYEFNTVPGANMYFGVPYTNQDMNTSMLIYTDGSAAMYVNKEVSQIIPSKTFTYSENKVYMNGNLMITLSEDGTQFEYMGATYTVDRSWCPHGVRVRKNQSESYSGDIHCYICGKFMETGINLIHNNVIPEGGVYYVGVTSTTTGDYTGATATYESEDEFPETVSEGDIYVYGDYEYRYSCSYLASFWTSPSRGFSGFNGWGVRVLDTTKTSYSAILRTINKKDVTSLICTYYLCESLTDTWNILIPNTVNNLGYMFANCTSLKDVHNLKIPNGVVGMEKTFSECTNLLVAPDVPSKVESMVGTFNGCTSLVGAITINATPETYGECLKGTGITQILGDCKIKDEILATK